MDNLNDKVAYITGGSKGIGFGIAKILSKQGMKVAISSRSLQGSKKAAEQLSKDASKVLPLQSDVTSLQSEMAAIKSVKEQFGHLDVLVANAGVGHFAPIENMTPEDW